MAGEISNVFSHVKLNKDNVENDMVAGDSSEDIENDMVEVESNEDNIENEIVELNEMVETGVENKAEDLKLGMMFDSIVDVVIYYRRYAKEKGFVVAKRTSKKGDDGVVRYVTIACSYVGKPMIRLNCPGIKRTRSTNPVKLKPQTKTNCEAQLRLVLCPIAKWILRSIILDHNHGLSPSKTRFYKCNRIIEPHVKKKLELHDKAGIRMNKSFNSFVVAVGGHKNLSFLEKDCRNHMEKVRRSHLRERDASAMYHYFLKMQVDNFEFFYTMDFDDDGQLKNVFWANARIRAAFKEFDDVVTFDTTYMVSKYEMPFAPFVGMNHHGQSTLLGCGLILREDTNSFILLFKCWLACMSNCPPNAIITDQDKAMKKAIEIVFPNARHR
nr:protein FAR-RED IMPAIRED RESPONSE 1-like [Quercus suber]